MLEYIAGNLGMQLRCPVTWSSLSKGIESGWQGAGFATCMHAYAWDQVNDLHACTAYLCCSDDSLVQLG